MRPVYPPLSQLLRCETCGAPVDEANGNCNAPLCQTKARVKAAQETAAAVAKTEERETKLATRRTTKLLRTAARRAEAETLGAIAYAIVPHVRGETAPRTDDRSKSFLEHLDAIIDEAFSGSRGAARKYSHEETPDEDFANWDSITIDDPAALAASCIACQGDCCYWGNASNAFLSPNTIAWVRFQLPAITADEIRTAYLEKMPPKSVPDSCVFHGPKGCTLPRNMRADVCNRWQCSYRRRLEQQIAKKGSGRSVVVGLPRDHHHRPDAGGPSVKVVSVDEANGVRVHSDLQLPAIRLPKSP